MTVKSKLLIAAAVLAVLFFAGFFAFNVHAYIVRRQEIQTSIEDAAEIADIFDAWLNNQLPPVTLTEPPPDDTPEEEDLPPLWQPIPYVGSPEYMEIPPDEEEVQRPICFYSLLAAIRTQTRNPDIVAFINIRGTNIQYAVVQTDNNEFYLNHSIRRYRNQSGTIFMDYRNSPDFSDKNTILYGHHLQSGTKFSQLFRFRSRSFFNDNRIIQIFTDNALIEYEIFAVFTTHISFNYIQTEFQEGEFAALIDEMIQRSNVNTRIRVTEEDRLLVLSTCTTVYQDDRFVVVGRRITP